MVCIFSYMVSHFGLSILDGCIRYKRRILFIHHLKSRHFSAMMSHWHMNPSLLDALVPGPVCFHFTWWILVLKATNNMLFKSRLLESTSLHHNPPIHKLLSYARLRLYATLTSHNLPLAFKDPKLKQIGQNVTSKCTLFGWL